MSYTDQAFIKAYQSEVTPEPASPAMRTHQSHGHGPHVHFAGPTRRPLSAALAEETTPSAQPSTISADAIPGIAGVVLETFSLPSVVSHLATECGDSYRRMMAYASRSGEVIGFLGAGEGAGCSTTTLAAGLAVAATAGPVAVIDAVPGSPKLIQSLGIQSSPSIDRVIERGGLASEGLLHSAEHQLSIGKAFDSTVGADSSVSGALRALTATHSAVLIDLGSDIESIATQPARGADSLRLDAVVIVRQAGRGEAEVMFARRVLAAAGHTVVGVIESFC